MGRLLVPDGSSNPLQMIEDPALLAKDLTHLAEMLAEQGQLEQALDASQAATVMYQRSLGLPVTVPCNQVPQCECGAPNAAHAGLLPSRDRPEVLDLSLMSGISKKRHEWASHILGINAVGLVKYFRWS